MFASKKFIDLSRKFVCVRIDSYESKEHQEWVRNFLNGRFANTTFCVLAPNGQDRLTRAGRSPGAVLGGGDEQAMRAMAAIAKKYPVKFNQSQAVVQDFHSVGQALNVASADQRLLVLVTGKKEQIEAAKRKLKPAINHKDHIGRFHVDFELGRDWSDSIQGADAKDGFLLVKAGEFGLTGKVIVQLPLTAGSSDIHRALTKVNETFAATTEKKEYQDHVRKGHRLGIKYESVIPYGEDRDGDGEIDKKSRRRSGSR